MLYNTVTQTLNLSIHCKSIKTIKKKQKFVNNIHVLPHIFLEL